MALLAKLILAIFYYVVLTPVAVVRRLVGGNPMHHQLGDKGYWRPHVPADGSPEDMKSMS